MAITDGIFGGILDFIGGERRNAAAEDAVKEQEQFQMYMSNSAYQRGVEDLKKAGLNPMLAYMKSPASTPSGGVAQVENSLGNAVNTAMSSAEKSETVKNLEATNRQIDATTEKTRAEKDEAISRTIKNFTENIFIQAETERSGHSATHVQQQITNMIEQMLNIKQERENLFAQEKETRMKTEKTQEETASERLRQFGLKNRAVHEHEYAPWAQHVRPFLEDAQRFFGSASSARRMFDWIGRYRR